MVDFGFCVTYANQDFHASKVTNFNRLPTATTFFTPNHVTFYKGYSQEICYEIAFKMIQAWSGVFHTVIPIECAERKPNVIPI